MEKFYGGKIQSASLQEEKQVMKSNDLKTIEETSMDEYKIEDIDFIDMEKELLNEFHADIKKQEDSLKSYDDLDEYASI